jgi:hypothetical protein
VQVDKGCYYSHNKKSAGNNPHKTAASRPKSLIWLEKLPFSPSGFAIALVFYDTFVLCRGNGLRKTAVSQRNIAFALHGSVGIGSIYLLLQLQ